MLGNFNSLTRGQLRIELDKRGEDTRGTKPILIERLEACLREENAQVETASNVIENAQPDISPQRLEQMIIGEVL